MVGIVNRSLKQQATWWPVSPNGTGGDVFGAPTLLNVRWEEKQETYIGQIDRREQVSKAIVFVEQQVSVGDYLALGDHLLDSDPTLLAGAEKVQRFDRIPDLRSLEALNKAML